MASAHVPLKSASDQGASKHVIGVELTVSSPDQLGIAISSSPAEHGEGQPFCLRHTERRIPSSPVDLPVPSMSGHTASDGGKSSGGSGSDVSVCERVTYCRSVAPQTNQIGNARSGAP